MTATLIAFEGPDRHGKSTQANMLLKSYVEDGHKTCLIKVPTSYCRRTHRLIYAMLANGWARRLPHLFQLVHFINKLLFQVLYLPKLLASYDVVILDRWALSATIYGTVDGVKPWFSRALSSLLKRPNMTIVFHGHPFNRGTIDDSYEKDGGFQQRVARGYVDWAMEHPFDHMLVNNQFKDVNGIHYQVAVQLAIHGLP
jgi:thymidylate kinase